MEGPRQPRSSLAADSSGGRLQTDQMADAPWSPLGYPEVGPAVRRPVHPMPFGENRLPHTKTNVNEPDGALHRAQVTLTPRRGTPADGPARHSDAQQLRALDTRPSLHGTCT